MRRAIGLFEIFHCLVRNIATLNYKKWMRCGGKPLIEGYDSILAPHHDTKTISIYYAFIWWWWLWWEFTAKRHKLTSRSRLTPWVDDSFELIKFNKNKSELLLFIHMHTLRRLYLWYCRGQFFVFSLSLTFISLFFYVYTLDIDVLYLHLYGSSTLMSNDLGSFLLL